MASIPVATVERRAALGRQPRRSGPLDRRTPLRRDLLLGRAPDRLLPGLGLAAWSDDPAGRARPGGGEPARLCGRGSDLRAPRRGRSARLSQSPGLRRQSDAAGRGSDPAGPRLARLADAAGLRGGADRVLGRPPFGDADLRDRPDLRHEERQRPERAADRPTCGSTGRSMSGRSPPVSRCSPISRASTISAASTGRRSRRCRA